MAGPVRARALRGFCLGVGQYASPGEVHDLPLSLFQILNSAGSVERVPDEAPPEPAAPGADAKTTTKAGAARR